jgi:hypothetical protein
MAPFETRSGQWIEVRIPFRALKGTWRGESVDADFDPAKVASFGIQLSDKIAGPFSLEVDWMKSYSP